MDTPAVRLEIAKNSLGISAAKIAEDMGVSKQVVSEWLSERTTIRKPNGLAIQTLYGISWKWLLDGEGSMYVDGGLGVRLLDEWTERPLIAGAASCGPGGEIADPGPGAVRVPFRRRFLQDLTRASGGGNTDDLYLIECVGESMRPTVQPGDLAVINTAIELRIKPRQHGLYLVRTYPGSSDGRIKRVRLDDGRLWLLSEAPGYGPRFVDLDGLPLQTVILGRVCWIARSVLHDERQDLDW